MTTKKKATSDPRFRSAKEAAQASEEAKQTEIVRLRLPIYTIDQLKTAAKQVGVSFNSFLNVLIWMQLQEEKDKLQHGVSIPKDTTLHKVLLVLEWTRHDNGQTETAQLPMLGPFDDYILIERGPELASREYTIRFRRRKV